MQKRRLCQETSSVFLSNKLHQWRNGTATIVLETLILKWWRSTTYFYFIFFLHHGWYKPNKKNHTESCTFRTKVLEVFWHLTVQRFLGSSLELCWVFSRVSAFDNNKIISRYSFKVFIYFHQGGHNRFDFVCLLVSFLRLTHSVTKRFPELQVIKPWCGCRSLFQEFWKELNQKPRRHCLDVLMKKM